MSFICDTVKSVLTNKNAKKQLYYNWTTQDNNPTPSYNTTSPLINSQNITPQPTTIQNKSTIIPVKSLDLSSSGKLVVSTDGQQKYVDKGGSKIINIDINNDNTDNEEKKIIEKEKEKENKSKITTNPKKIKNNSPSTKKQIKAPFQENLSIIENYPNSNLQPNSPNNLNNYPSSINYNINNSIVISPINVYSPNKNLSNENDNGNVVNKNLMNQFEQISKFSKSQKNNHEADNSSKNSNGITFGNNMMFPVYDINSHIPTPDIATNLGPYLNNELSGYPEGFMNNNDKKGFRLCDEQSQAGCDPNGNIKTNQDTSLISLSLGGVPGINLFGVLDGHGELGHIVSRYCKDYFIRNITNYIKTLIQQNGYSNAEQIYNSLKMTQYQYITSLFLMADEELGSKIDCSLSGTTCNLIFQFNHHLVCFNVGDSRCIVVYDQGGGTNQGILPLSQDHKPNLPEEQARINQFSGVVDYLKDFEGNNIGPARVFRADSSFPGLAMSRSLGDFEAKTCGVISNPEIIEYDIQSNTKYLLVCSDGVWEFLSNEHVRNLANMYYANNQIKEFCTQLIAQATLAWKQMQLIRDDITVVCVYF